MHVHAASLTWSVSVLQVSYSTDNFLVKNRDFVVAEHQLLLENSSETFIKVLFPAEVEAEPAQVLTECNVFCNRVAECCCAPPAHAIAASRRLPILINVQGKGSKVGQGYKFSSVASRFKRQLADLMDALHRMEPHYIRCIKPNSRNRCARMHPHLRNKQIVMQMAICRLKCSSERSRTLASLF